MTTSTGRRNFLAGLAALGVGTAGGRAFAAGGDKSERYTLCVFEKFLQELSYDELADVIAELGFAGIEATVRKNGHVAPERVEDDLPRMHSALKKRGLEVTMMATDVRSADQPLTEKVLRVAKGLGITRYRMGSHRYDLSKPVWQQVDELRPVFKDLAALNKELGVQGMYQNHSGKNFFGATVWDLHEVVKQLDPKVLGVAFDIRHAAVEAGLSWELLYRLMRKHIAAVYVKDFRWQGRRAVHAPLGNQVDPKFFKMLARDGYQGPISLHVEYLPKGGTAENIAALKRDLKTLRGWI